MLLCWWGNIMRYIVTIEFLDKRWTTNSIKRLLKKFKDVGTVERHQGSNRPQSARTDENTWADELYGSDSRVLAPYSQHSLWKSRKTGIPQSPVVRIIRKDLQLKCFNGQRAHGKSRQSHSYFPQVNKYAFKKLVVLFIIFFFYSSEMMWKSVKTSRS